MADLFDEGEIYRAEIPGTKQEIADRNFRAGWWRGYLMGAVCLVCVVAAWLYANAHTGERVCTPAAVGRLA